MLCFVTRQAGRQAEHTLILLVSVLHLTLHVRILMCAAAQTCDPHMKPQYSLHLTQRVVVSVKCQMA